MSIGIVFVLPILSGLLPSSTRFRAAPATASTLASDSRPASSTNKVSTLAAKRKRQDVLPRHQSLVGGPLATLREAAIKEEEPGPAKLAGPRRLTGTVRRFGSAGQQRSGQANQRNVAGVPYAALGIGARAPDEPLMDDQDGIRAVGAAVSALAVEPNPPDAFIRGDHRRLRVGVYRIMYVVEGEIITIERVDLVV